MLHNTRDGSEFYVPYTFRTICNFRGRTWALGRVLTVRSFSIKFFFNSRLQKNSITTIHHDEKHDFFFHLVNSATMEINYEDMCILQFGQSQ